MAAPRLDPDRAPAPIVALSEDFPSLRGADHAHRRAQLVYAVHGVVRAHAGRGLYVLPSRRALWVPGGVPHRIESGRPFGLRTVYFDETRRRGLPRAVAVVEVPPLVRELVLALTRAPFDYPPRSPAARLADVLVDQLRTLPTAPLELPVARDPRLVRVTEALAADPADPRALPAFARAARTSARHLARLFVAETGLTFGAYRTQVRLHAAIERLGAGAAPSTVAFEVGYESPAAFGAIFKKVLGTTPGRYFARSDDEPPPAGKMR